MGVTVEVVTAEPAGGRGVPAGRPTALEHTLAGLLAEVLGGEPMPVDRHFFDDLGADSMVMARFCARVRKRTDLPPVSMKDIYQHPTTRSLATALADAPPTEAERHLAETLAEVLGVERVPVLSHFFDDLGADSMVMARFCARVRKRTDLPSVSMKDIYQHPTIRSLSTALPKSDPTSVESSAAALIPSQRSVAVRTAVPTPPIPAPTAVATSSSAPERPAAQARPSVPGPAPLPAEAPAPGGAVAYVVCGALQFLIFLGYSYLLAVVVTAGNRWISAGIGPLAIYERSVLAGGASFVGLCVFPIIAKWLLVGRWKPRRIRVWSLAYVRFWTVKTLIRSSPMILFVGSPLYVLYLRALGAKIGRNVVILSRSAPVCTDLLTIGDGTVVRQDAFLSGYRAHAGVIETGAVTLGRDVFVGEATVIDINTSLGDGAQLGRSSSLHSGQAVPAGERWHGSPARRTEVDYRTIGSTGRTTFRKLSYTAGQLFNVLFLYMPLAFGGAALLLTEVPQLAALLGSEPLALTSWTFYRDALVASSVLFFGSVILGLTIVLTVPRLLNLALSPDRIYPLYGFHYGIHRAIVRMTNIKLFTRIFGDSSAITHYLSRLGYDLSQVQQTGSNFGTEVRQEIPYLSTIGSETMVADGLSIINTDYSNTSFRVSRTSIGPRNFLGNRIAYPAQGRTGDNCLLATKVMIPVDGKIREGVGLLGSPSFEIPRSVERDTRLNQVRSPAELRRLLAAKNRHNITTMGYFLLTRWIYVFGLLLLTGVAVDLYDMFGELAIAMDLVVTPVFTATYFVLLERLVTVFHPLRALDCSIYDRRFWRRERYWKVPSEVYLQAFNGTPFKNLIWRLLGVRLGRRVFDDGCYLTERTLGTIGDGATLNAGSVIQCHSQEDGAFKSAATALGAGCTLGVGAFVHYGVTVGAGALLAPDSFLMKGEEVPPNARWGGNPAGELRDGATDRPVRSNVAARPDPDLWLVSPRRGTRRVLTPWRPPALWITLPAALTTLIWAPQVVPGLWATLLVQLGIGTAPGSTPAPAGPTAEFQWLLPILGGLTLLVAVIGAISWARRTRSIATDPVAIERAWARRTVAPAAITPTPHPRPATAAAVAAVAAVAPSPHPRPATPTAVTPTPHPRPATPVAAVTPTPHPRPATPAVVEATAAAEPAAVAKPAAVAEPTAVAEPAAVAEPTAVVEPARNARPAPAVMAAEDPGPAPWTFVAVAAAIVLLALPVLADLGRRIATAGEALLAAATALQPGSALAPPSWPDRIAAPQIAALDILVPASGQEGILAGARTALLVVSVLGCLLLWPVARRLALSAQASALPVGLASVAGLATSLFGSVDAGALAALWLTAGAALAGRSRGATVLAVGATVIAAATAPLAAVGPLALAAHGLLTGVFAVSWRLAVTRALGVAAAAAAGLVAAQATGLWPLGSGAWVATGRGAAPAEVLVGFLAAGALVVVLAWFRTRSLRPVVTAAAALLGCAAIPGPQATTALLLAVPVLAVLAAATIEELTVRVPVWRGVLLGAALVAGAANAWALVVTPVPVEPDRARLSAWITTQLDPTAQLRVDPLTGAQLIRDGIARGRLIPADVPAPAGSLSVVTAGAGDPQAAGARVLVTVPHGPGGGETSVVAADPGPDQQAEQRLLESRLADNTALTLAPAAADALRNGQVDLRLATALSGLTAVHRLGIADFGAVPGEPADAPRRIALITDVDGASAAVPGVTDLVQRWLASQLPAYRPAETAVDHGVLVVRYTAPFPAGLAAR